MVNDSVASTIPDQKARRPKTAAERQRAYRQRKRQRQIAAASAPAEAEAEVLPNDQPVPSAAGLPVTSNVTVSPAALPVTPVTLAVTLPLAADVTHVTEPLSQVTNGRPISAHGLTVAALALAAVGITMNGWFAQTLGSTDLAGLLFLAIGIASDLVALAVPPTAVQLWQARRRATAIIAWLVWLATFVFAVTSGIGFASVNIADVTLPARHA